VKTDIIYRSIYRFIWEGIEGLILLPLIVPSWPLSKRWFNNWGATTLECSKVWPGDILTPTEVTTFTRAIDINASTNTVWKWIVQFGLYRGGFYSYELLERLAGIPVKNIESILPEYQSLELEEKIKLHPKEPGLPVGALSEGKHLCFGQLNANSEDTLDPQKSWSIYIESLGKNSCRLLLRSCIEKPRKTTIRKQLSLALETPIDFLMEQRMLRTIRRLTESVKS